MASDVNDTVGRARECEKLRDMMVAADEEYAIGGAIAVNIVGNNGGLLLSSDRADPRHRLHRYINRVGRNLGAQSDRPNLEWTFGVLDTDDFNAYSTPGGYVFVSRGLLSAVQTEAELAGVLAHEIAHVTERHALKLYSAITANQCQTALAAEVGATEAADALGFKNALDSPVGFFDLNDVANVDILGKLVNGLVDDLTTRGFAADDEYDSDARAAELMMNAGYDPREYMKFLSKIPAQGSTHPANETRQARLQAWEAEKLAQNDPFSLVPGSKRLRRIRIKTQLRPIK
ncbi:MAG: M48 family metalloprotease [Myxococcota bacterium]